MLVQLLPRVLVRFAGIFRPLQLHFQTFSSNLKAVHGLNGTLCREGIVIAHEPKALAEVSVLVYEHFGAYDTAKRLEHLDQVCILYVVREMINEEITPLRACGVMATLLIILKMKGVYPPSRCF